MSGGCLVGVWGMSKRVGGMMGVGVGGKINRESAQFTWSSLHCILFGLFIICRCCRELSEVRWSLARAER